MQPKEQRYTPQGKRCTGVIISDHWVATSEDCCDNVAGAILDFNDDRGDGDGGSGSTGGSSVNLPCTGPCFNGRRKRRAACLRACSGSLAAERRYLWIFVHIYYSHVSSALLTSPLNLTSPVFSFFRVSVFFARPPRAWASRTTMSHENSKLFSQCGSAALER